tara:strand:+ start:364 stop:618 length:255 start_codon:yes stop_codon:yes gene_type:complete
MKNALNIATALLIFLFFGYQFYTQNCEEKCEENTESKCSSEEKKECKSTTDNSVSEIVESDLTVDSIVPKTNIISDSLIKSDSL